MRLRAELCVLALFLALAFGFFWPVTFGGKTLVPADNLFAWEPWRSLRGQYGVGVPHNELLSDLILENYVWKLFIRQCLARGELPLWNPYIFTGVPFLAAGQHSALYPLSIVYYVLPLPLAYGVFAALQLVLAGFGTYLFARSLGATPPAAVLGGVAFAFSLFMVVSVAFPMMIAAAAWLPWCLLAVELALRRTFSCPEGRAQLGRGIPWLSFGALCLGMQVLAGHMEMTYYVLLVCGLYSAWWLARESLRRKRLAWQGAVTIACLVLLGLGLAAVQLVPFYELARTNFRSGAAGYQVTYKDIVGWAYPWRQLITFVVPDFYGNPSVHSYIDIVSLRRLPITHNALGEPIAEVSWGKGLPSWKNYVEAGSYVGLLPLLLLWPALAHRRLRAVALPFACLAVFALLLVFGTPLYRLIFVLPGVNQLHSPFRWVFPYTFAMACLAALGLSALSSEDGAARRAGRWVSAGATLAGAGLALLAVLVLAVPQPFIALADRLLAFSELTQRAFADGRMFLSYQYRNLLQLAAALLGSGLAVGACLRSQRLQPLAAAVLFADLAAVGFGFYPRAEPRLLSVVPPAVQFLQAQKGIEPWRLTTFIRPGQKPLNANSGMLYGLEDIRGYDSIIPRQYVDFMSALQEQDELLYNRIAPLWRPEALASPLLDLLNVRYVLSEERIEAPGYKLVYDGPLRIYENEDYLPRAFILTGARRVPASTLLGELRKADVRTAVLLEGEESAEGEVPARLLPVQLLQHFANEVYLRASVPVRGWLVVTDAYFPGWRAYVRPAGGGGEREVPIERAYGAFRAIALEPGEWEVRLRYMPRSLQVGLYTSFLSAVALLLLGATWLWARHRPREGTEHTVQRVARNSLTPMALSLVNKLVDMAFAMLLLRILAPEGAGRYQFAVTFIGYFEILARFGLGTLMTREVACNPALGRRYLANALALRALLWLGCLPLMGLLLLGYVVLAGLTLDVVVAVALFAGAMLLSNVADAFSAIFYAHERMELPAFLATATALVKVSFGALALLLGGGFIGVAAASVLSNAFSAGALGLLLSRRYLRPAVALERDFAREMLRESFPLMINHLLATVFFQVDILLLQPLRGNIEVGYYSAAYRYIRGLDIIPGYFTMALFPVMSRYARSALDSLQRAYLLSLRLLFAVSFPLAVGTTLIARELILFLAGPDYLPHSQLALQLLIWYMPVGFVNSVTQYVLIALGEQRYLTRAFLIGVGFNIIANLVAIPFFGYRAAAVVTVLSELVLCVPFMRRLRRHLGAVPWFELAWRPAASAITMGFCLQALRLAGLHVLLLIPAGAAIYGLGLLITGMGRVPDMELVIGLLARRLQRA